MAIPVIVLQPGEYYGTQYDLGETFSVADADHDSLVRHVEMGNLHPTDVGAYTEAYTAQDYAYGCVVIDDLKTAADQDETLEVVSLSDLKTIVAAATDWAAFQTAIAALTTGSKPSAYEAFRTALDDIEAFTPPLGRRWS